MLALKELLHNLKDRNWDVNPTYKIDENEARKIIQALDETDKKIADYTYMIGILQDRIEEIEKSDKWRLCKDELPNEYDEVICYTSEGEVCIAAYLGKMNDGVDCFDDDTGMMWEGDVVAWQPLPQFYKAESEEVL